VPIAIIGNSGSGKSTLARRLAQASGADRLDLDTIAWEPGEPGVARTLVERFFRSGADWIVDGC
jgi:adenylate kinase family enzyme